MKTLWMRALFSLFLELEDGALRVRSSLYWSSDGALFGSD
jgi:hypothetical protein